jgi:O-antigen ligase
MTRFPDALLDRASKYLPALLLVTYGVFTIGYFFFPDYNNQYRFYTKAVFFPAIFVLLTPLREIWKQPLFRLILLYLIYMLASALWSDPFRLYEFGQRLTLSVFILSFIAITHYLNDRYKVGFDRLLQLAVFVAAVAAIISLVVWYRNHVFPLSRLMGMGALTNVNEYANVYGIFALLATGYLLRASSLHERVLYIFAAMAFLCFIWFGQSRTAFVALFAALLVLVFNIAGQERIRSVAWLMAFIGILAIFSHGVIDHAWSRGASFRLQIWEEVITEVAEAPVFGHGLLSEMHIWVSGVDYQMPHNAFLSVLWQGGVIGLGLFLLLIVSAFRQAWRFGKEQGRFVVFSILVFSTGIMLTSVDDLIVRPRDRWLVFWFPLALLISYKTILARNSRPSDAGQGN